MEAHETLTISQKSRFSRLWEITNGHDGRVGAFRTVRRFGYFRGEGEAAAATRTFVYAGWGLARGEVRDEWSHAIGAMHRSFGARSAQLILYEKEYVWHTDVGGTFFSISLTDGTELVRVTGCGGFGMGGTIDVRESIENGELLTLVYMGLFQTRAREAEIALVSGAIAVIALLGGTALLP